MKTPVESSRLLTLVELIGGRSVAVAGDLIADEFIYGEIARVSRAARATPPATSPRSAAPRGSPASSAATKRAGGWSARSGRSA